MNRHATRGETDQPAATENTRLMVATRGDAQFCFRLVDVSEVGKIVQLARMDGSQDAYLGSTVLHGWAVPVVDVAAAIGAVPEKADEPRMFVATETDPIVCVVVDEIVGIRERGQGGEAEGAHELVRSLITMDGHSLPMIDVSATARLADSAASPAHSCDDARGEP